jgi:branched-chain amino acid aminotransferase
MTATTTTAPATGGFGTVMAPTMATCEVVDGRFGEVRFGPVAAAVAAPGSPRAALRQRDLRGAEGPPRPRRGRAAVPPRPSRRPDADLAELLCLPARTPTCSPTIVEVVAPTSRSPHPPRVALPPTGPARDRSQHRCGRDPVHRRAALHLASPVGDYFRGDGAGLRLAVETELPRTTPQFGQAKSGANYAMALGVTRRARAEHGADQVLFAPAATCRRPAPPTSSCSTTGR